MNFSVHMKVVPVLDFFFINLFIYLFLFLAALGLRCCARAFSSCGERGLLLVVVRGLLIAVASLVRSTGSRHVGFSSCGTWALERRLSSCSARALSLRGMWDFLGPGIEPVSPTLAGGFLTTVLPGKPPNAEF